jgi:hypothetical protein
MLSDVSFELTVNHWRDWDLRLAFEVLHNIEKSVVYIWLICKLDFDLVKVTERVLRERNSQSQLSSNACDEANAAEGPKRTFITTRTPSISTSRRRSRKFWY